MGGFVLVAIVGNGGHAAVIREALELSCAPDGRSWRVEGCYDKHKPVPTWLPYALGVGRRRLRREIVSSLAADVEWVTVVHPRAIVSPSAVKIGVGVQIMAGAIIQAGAVIGNHAIINTGAQVDHGCRIGDFAHICPGAVLCADVTVEDGAMVQPGRVVWRGMHVPYGHEPESAE